ncbi:hypothetical protein [Streptomyces avidinii]|uniref:ABC-2 family transporter n=1 Tax=Streptomyces avidinii TaxID=1895 RepID=A0ABS4LGK7_STRAV|nr:hypothetical protein [Streptomyces avidinii]MBP2041161.1 hypothetical protein [Streptomyces avidinii]GGZ04912.1 hypothetical protein GCM10010343_33640 [Streptomyces avidinii]
MRWLTLYARSRRAPASLAAVLISAVAVGALARIGGGGPVDPRLSTLALAAGATALAVGLGGQDLALDRTAAIRWVPRRAVHVLLCGMLIGAVLLAVQTMEGQPASTALVVRNSAGLMGLVALGAAWCGGPYAWIPPFASLSLSFVVPPAPDPATQVLTWMLLPPGTTAGVWTALVLAVAGTTAYAVAGPRR